MKFPDPLAVGWVAGIFEGEGSVRLDKRSTRSASIQVQMTDEDVVRRLLEVTEVGYINGPYQSRPDWKPWWTWVVSDRANVSYILGMLYPLMGERRKRQMDGLWDRLGQTRQLRPCGTVAAYQRHRRNGEEACEACLLANRERGKRAVSYDGAGKLVLS